jgi:hypothetical protein
MHMHLVILVILRNLKRRDKRWYISRSIFIQIQQNLYLIMAIRSTNVRVKDI